MTTPSVSLRDRLIPWYFVLFFAVVILVDGVLAVLAIRSDTGLVTEQAYEKGLAYNQIIAAEARQETLGWRAAIAYTPDARTPHSGKLTVTVRDRQGETVELERASALFTRPTQAGMDFSLPLTPAADGSWEAHPRFPLPGLWEVRVYSERGERRFQQARRITVE